MTKGMLHGFGAATPCPESERPACVEAGFLPGLPQPGKLQLANARTRRGVLLWCLAGGLAIGLLGVLSAPATAADSGRLRLVQVLEDGKDGVEGMFGPLASAVSPDGANVYVTAWYGDALTVFARDAQSGRLTFLEAQRNGTNGIDGLGNANGVAVSPDGAHVYAIGEDSAAITAFARDSLTGRLTFVQTQRDGLPGPDPILHGFAVSYGLAVSPDGAHVYVSGHAQENDVAAFARDAASGMLTPIELVSTGLPPADALRVSPDGAYVYAAGGAGAVTALQRDSATGRLTRLAAWQREGVSGELGLDTNILTLSPDGASIYLAGYHDHSVAVLAPDPQTASLSLLQTVRSGVEGLRGLKGARGVVVSPDGAHLWAAGWADKAIALFARDTTTGRLDFVEARRDVLTDWVGMGEVYGPALSPDGRHLYVPSVSYSAILVFSTDEGGMAPIVRCVGDCDWNTQVTVDELVLGVNIALGTTPLSACEMFDNEGDGAVTVDNLVRGVNNALTGCTDPLTPGDHRRTLAVGGYSRIYDVHVPPGYDGSTAAPLVLDFHGSALNQTDQAGVSGWRSVADSEGFIVAYPLGLFGQSEAPEVDANATHATHGPSLNGGPLCCGQAAQRRIDDVGFARAIVQAVATEANIDRTRVYATGLSNGGFMSYRLACEAADVFAAVAPVAGRIGLFPTTSCQPSRPIAVIEFAGLHDPKVLYHDPGNSGLWPSAVESFAYWRDASGCGSGPPDERTDFGTSYCETYRSCGAGVQVELCSIEASPVSYAVGHCLYLNPDIDIADAAWKFLSRFRLPAQ
jgi:poly(3-hydroxybutyrate) depolymerase/6-phosphogluconolactonase (cycloisomerase 2 family)